ncbi:hypothetical protein [Micromonospora sp. SL4-19]|uniref:hypothetical protein n=1 Tax=Micromonospora sp. SL4-19 TaxID=3399129 RepID=UPI003A4D2319
MRQGKQQVTREDPETVRSAPVAPPGEADGRRDARADVPEDAMDDRGTVDDPAAVDERAADAATGGRPPFHAPGPVPTGFGAAATVADAVAASAMASARAEDERDPRSEDTAQPGDGAPGRTDAFDDERADPTAGDRLHSREPQAAEPSGQTRHDAPAAGAAGYGSAEPAMVDPDASTAAAAAAGAADAGPRAGTAGATLARAAQPTPGAVPADAATLFAPEIARGFRDRWREVQLRFVDDPRAAVGEAQSLVEEAIEALSAALREQRTKLGGWQQSGSTDTEQLRVAVRDYRDFLDRVLGR